MSNTNDNNLDYVTNKMVKDARGVSLCPYLIALEGWRRGLKLEWFPSDSKEGNVKKEGNLNLPTKLYRLSSDKSEHFFFRSRGDEVSEEAINICKNKEETKERLKKNDVPTPEGKRFGNEATIEEIIEYGLNLGFPIVVKPTNGSLGKGVIANINNKSELENAYNYVRYELKYSDVIVEKYVNGSEHRVYVVGDKVIGAIKKLPPNVIGDGMSKIETLIKNKNTERLSNPHLSKRPIKIDYEVLNCIEEYGYNLNSIIKKDEQIFLRKKNSLSSGGDPVDSTDELSDNIKSIAVNAVASIPNLNQAGLDLIVDIDNDIGVVIELNGTAIIGSHVFPGKGQARDIPSAIIDYYFPETINLEKSQLYFDFKSVKQVFENKIVNSLTLAPAPEGKLFTRKYIVTGKVQRVGYRQWIRKQALKQGLNGYTKNLMNGKVVVVVASANKQQLEDFKKVCLKGSVKSDVEKVTSHEWDRPLKLGFEIKSNMKAQPKKKNKQTKNMKNPNNQFISEEKYNAVINSRSWRYTSPLRTIIKKIKN
ncbi:acylphosphatase [Salipaludibacillus daqingensis]|uniref:acylphosphatase n=1 Tax=Salipaludibacillus daqingensis TaxID=3041001 RepID=UPI002475A904|nr:acylphosphatase [Salipaludibacillus daqingensis]